MAYRGPDDEGFYHDDVISLGQRRLSINDISGGRQPIASEDGRYQLVCNGEIYNSPSLRRELEGRGHRFQTGTDVEVILHLFEESGLDCVSRLRGMFAFAIWDAQAKRLFLARDHLGQKPLFFCQAGGSFAFASEPKALLHTGIVQPKIDLNGLWHYVSLRFLPDEHTFFCGIHKLPAASCLAFDQGTGKLEINRYWALSFEPKRKESESGVADLLEELLSETVSDHLLSDVPVGSFLSGGIDSSLITALMAKSFGKSFPTFSIGVEEQGFNELPFARQVVQQYGLDGCEEVVRADMIHLIPEMIHHLDEPSDPFGAGVFLVSRLASTQVKVVLGGDGGDESFAGYDRFAGQRMAEMMSTLPAWFRRSVIKRLTGLVPESFGYKSLAQKAAWLNDMSFYESGERYARSMSFLRFTTEAKQRLFTPQARREIDEEDSVRKVLHYFDAENASELVDRMLHTDLMTRIPDHLLMIVDRMSMAHSLESRSPLLDHRVVEFAASIPADMKLKGRRLKHILKVVAARHLPAELIDRPKQGFGFPVALWMRKELRGFLTLLFEQSRFVELGLFDGDEMRSILREHLDGRRDHNFRIWILMNLEIWYRMYFEGETVDSSRAFIDSLMGGPGGS